jgi:hypothetical protein
MCLVFLIAGCGYSTRSIISNKYKTICIIPFVNKIDITNQLDTASKYKVYKPLLDTDITKEVSSRFLKDGNLKIAPKESADLILKGEVVDFVRDPLRYTDDNDVQEYRLNIRVNISLWNNRDNKLIWEENNFTGEATYFTSYYPVASQRISESTAINNAILDLARRIVDRTIEEW